jgi:uncharacterized protein with von Willebrand factor type A (vWA) domain
MRFRYIAFDPRLHGRKERYRRLRRIFDILLLKTGGDVEDALRLLEHLGGRYRWFDEAYTIQDFRADLLQEGAVAEQPAGEGGGMVLTSRGEKALRRSALERIFEGLKAAGGGEHRTPFPGGQGEETEDTRPFAFGDPLETIAWTPTFRNALRRAAVDRSGPSAAFALCEEDLEVHEHEAHTGCATVLLVDVSHSMVLYGEDRMTPAREVALALTELITTRYRKDTLDLVLFGDDAERVPLHRIPYIQAGPFHTNTKAGLRLAQEILKARRHANKQVFMVTDGKPSAIFRDGELYKNPFGLDDEIVNRTLDEALSCRKAGIPVTTFMVASDPVLVRFVDEFTRLNRGRAYFTGIDRLGATLFVDWLRNRRARIL